VRSLDLQCLQPGVRAVKLHLYVPPFQLGVAPNAGARSSPLSLLIRCLAAPKLRGFPKRDSLSFSDPLDQFYEPEALLAHPDEPLIRDVELGEHDERE
jgi:hypothetical protein